MALERKERTENKTITGTETELVSFDVSSIALMSEDGGLAEKEKNRNGRGIRVELKLEPSG